MRLVTRICVLRAPALDDAPSIAKYANNRNVWLNVRDRFPHPYALEDAKHWIGSVADESPRVTFAIEVDGEACGGIGLALHHDIERISAEIGYWLGEPLWGRGIITEAVEVVTRYGFEE